MFSLAAHWTPTPNVGDRPECRVPSTVDERQRASYSGGGEPFLVRKHHRFQPPMLWERLGKGFPSSPLNLAHSSPPSKQTRILRDAHLEYRQIVSLIQFYKNARVIGAANITLKKNILWAGFVGKLKFCGFHSTYHRYPEIRSLKYSVPY